MEDSEGLGASGAVPLTLALIGDLYPHEPRGQPLGWLFRAMAGGMAFGSSLGIMLVPHVGWRMLFVGVAGGTAIVFGVLLRDSALLGSETSVSVLSTADVMRGYRSLLDNARGIRRVVLPTSWKNS